VGRAYHNHAGWSRSEPVGSKESTECAGHQNSLGDWIECRRDSELGLNPNETTRRGAHTMMFQLGFLLALPFGYFLCIGHAKLTLVLYRHSPEGRREEADRLHAEWVRHHPPVPSAAVLPPSSHGDGRTLSEQWKLPTRPSRGSVEPLQLGHHGLIRTKRCPTGFSAAQVLGYHQIGRPDVSPLFDGGLDEWPY
jgi:hypothetical protein